jgi:hypothetical protein
MVQTVKESQCLSDVGEEGALRVLVVGRHLEFSNDFLIFLFTTFFCHRSVCTCECVRVCDYHLHHHIPSISLGFLLMNGLKVK